MEEIKTNTNLDKLDNETRTKIINEARANFDEYYKTELPKQIEKYAREEVDYRNEFKWITFGFELAALLVSITVLIIKTLFK